MFSDEENIDDELLKITFRIFDKDEDGKLSHTEFSKLIKEITVRLGTYIEKYTKILFFYCDVDDEKYISYDNLRHFWTSKHKLDILCDKKHIVEHAYMLFMTYTNNNCILESENFEQIIQDFNFKCDHEVVEEILSRKSYMNFKEFIECMNWFKEDEIDYEWAEMLDTKMMKKYKKSELKSSSSRRLFTWN